MTWWGRDKEIKWFNADDLTEIIGFLEEATMS